MPQVSKKGNILPASAIRKLVPFADAAKARGIKIHHLNIGQPDIETPKGAIDVLRKAPMDIVAYTNSAGNLSYRKKLCEYYAKQNIHITPDEIIVTNGGSEALQFAFTICCNPGDEVLIPEPYYTNYNSFAILSDSVIKTIPSSIKSVSTLLLPLLKWAKASASAKETIKLSPPDKILAACGCDGTCASSTRITSEPG